MSENKFTTILTKIFTGMLIMKNTTIYSTPSDERQKKGEVMEIESLYCDVCDAKITDFKNDLYHFSGFLKNKSSNHIHICAKCKEYLNPPLFDFDVALQNKIVTS